MNQYVDNIMHAFAQLDEDNEQLQRITTLTPELNWAEDNEIDEMLCRLAGLAGGISPPILDRGLEIVIGRLSRNASDNQADPSNPPPEQTDGSVGTRRVEAISELYHSLEGQARARNYLLGWLATINSGDSLQRFCRLIVESPPTCSQSIVVAFAPLLQHRRTFDVEQVFPQLLGGLQYPSVAAAILDLANFLKRENRVELHPADGHLSSLITMLGMLTEQLTMIEEGKIPPDKSPAELSNMVNDTVSLISSICDALSLIGNQDAIGKLNRAAGLKHRRIRAEALSALYSLGQEEAGGQLVELVAEPVIRLRVLHYAEELGLSDEIDEQYSSDSARAESQLAMWLVHPSNMGFAPRSLERLDQRRLAWPGFDEPVDCFLFRYSYELASSRIDNVGFAGPMAHAFSMNLIHLETSDIYACFAGWNCTHEEILELPIPQARLQRPGLIEKLMAFLSSELTNQDVDESSINNVIPSFLGIFMGEEALVVEGTRQGLTGTYVVDRDSVTWFPPDRDNSPARHELAYCIYKGRRLLGAFNHPEAWPGVGSREA